MTFTRSNLMTLIAVIVIMAFACGLAYAQVQNVKTLNVGRGGVTTKGGNITLKTTAGVQTMQMQPGVNAAGGSFNPWDWTGTLGIMDGSDDFTLFDINITNADHTSTSNTVQVMDIAAITGDAHATETAIKIGTGWDEGINCASAATFSTVSSLLPIATRITAQTPTLTVAAYPSGSVIVATHATPTVTLPAVATSAGVTYTIVNGGVGTTSFTIAAATACILSAGAVTGNGSATTTTLVWSASGRIVGVAATFVCDGTNWIMTSSNYAPTTLT
jgi:hypothetical protein